MRAPRRHVFKHQLDFMDPKLRDMYALYTSKDSGRGKRRRLNALINEVVPRDVSYGGDIRPEYVRAERNEGRRELRHAPMVSTEFHAAAFL